MTSAESALTPAEEGLWLLATMAPDRGVSQLGLSIRIPRRVRADTVRRGLAWLWERHPALRTVFTVVDGVPHRTALPASACPPVSAAEVTGRRELDEAATRVVTAPFDLTAGPLVRAGVLATARDTTVVVLAVHHVLVDASAMRVLAEELLDACASLDDDGTLPALAPPAAHAPDPVNPESLEHWRRYLRGYRAGGARLDSTREVGAAPRLTAGHVARHLRPDTVAAVAALRGALRASDHMVLLSAFHATLVRHGAADDLVVGAMTSGRSARRRWTVGNHVTTVPSRAAVPAGTSMRELVAQVRAGTLDSLAHANVSYGALLGLVGDARDPRQWRARLFRHLFNFRLTDSVAYRTDGGVRIEEVHSTFTPFDLELTVEKHDGALDVTLLYSDEAHDGDFAAAFLDRMEVILRATAADPDRPIAALDIRSAADRAMLDTANATVVAGAPDTVLAGVVRWASEHPDAPAVVEGAVTTSYGALLATAERLRAALVGRGVRRGDVVGLSAGRSARTAAAVLAVWAAGAAYVPLEPTHPPARLRRQLTELGCRTLVDTGGLAPELAADHGVVPVGDPHAGDEAPLRHDITASDLAYVIFTSGSSGRPKGVRVTHGNVANVVGHFAVGSGLPARPAATWMTTFAFDISLLELMVPLTAGGQVVVVADETRSDPGQFLDLVHRHDVSLLQTTPTLWQLLAPAAHGLLHGRVLLCGGEPLPTALARRLVATGARVLDVYGPTETTIWSTAAELSPAAPDDVTIGRPIANTRVAVLDAFDTPLPAFVHGELCVFGAGVSQGYWGRPDLTADRFFVHPDLGRGYRTGDLATWRADGTLTLLGRRDRQIALRGNRIEPAEVEAVLGESPHVRAAAVELRADLGQDQPYLVAFVECAPRHVPEVREHAAAWLPPYSVPEHVVAVPALPTTPNGKVDVSRLPTWTAAPDAPGPAGEPGSPGPLADPLTDLLTTAWRAVLGGESVDRDTNFFLAGGNSLLALRLVEQVTAATGVPITMLSVFRAPTPARMAAQLGSAAASDRPGHAGRARPE